MYVIVQVSRMLKFIWSVCEIFYQNLERLEFFVSLTSSLLISSYFLVRNPKSPMLPVNSSNYFNLYTGGFSKQLFHLNNKETKDSTLFRNKKSRLYRAGFHVCTIFFIFLFYLLTYWILETYTYSVVAYSTKVLKFKQITTEVYMWKQESQLLLIVQRY